MDKTVYVTTECPKYMYILYIQKNAYKEKLW